MAKAMVCSFSRHELCDGNVPNGPAGEGHPCSCYCHGASIQSEPVDLLAMVGRAIDAKRDRRRASDD